MFRSNYPSSRLTHPRVLQFLGLPTGMSIIPIPGPPLDPPEIVHQDCSTVHSLEPGVVYVAEWTGPQTEHHHVQL